MTKSPGGFDVVYGIGFRAEAGLFGAGDCSAAGAAGAWFDPMRMQEVGAAGRVAEVMGRPAMEPAERLVVDATGVGMPVVEMLVGAGMRCTVTPVLITGGFGEHSDGQVWHVPKVDLLAGLQGLLERGN